MIPESEILEYPQHKVKSKTGNIFVNEKILEKYSVKIYKIDPYFWEHYKEKTQVHKNGCEYMLFRTDAYFTEYLLTVEIDKKKKHVDRDLIFEEKRQKALEQNLVVNLLELIHVSVMMKIMKLVQYKHLSVNLKTES